MREGCEGRVTVGEAWCRRLCRGGVGCVGEVGRGGGCWHCGVCGGGEVTGDGRLGSDLLGRL